ncbi:MAG: hypothetical protein IMZ50_17285 [Candidatus Atribacteria bacterium]|nr:hypothetical protein [Candidatus Atribacteria bacterium]
MKFEEQVVFEYLQKVGYQNVFYEPGGNIPPDFCVDREIGVEVRRLSQLHFSAGRYKSLEEDRIKIIRSIRDVLKEFDQESPGVSYRVIPEYSRPLGSLRLIRRELRAKLKDVLLGRIPIPREIALSRNVNIRVAKAALPDKRQFSVLFEVDEDSGGSVTEIYVTDIAQCLNEKLRKVSPYWRNYNHWWLVLVDFIVAVSGSDADEIVDRIRRPPEFERVIIIDPLRLEATFELRN